MIPDEAVMDAETGAVFGTLDEKVGPAALEKHSNVTEIATVDQEVQNAPQAPQTSPAVPSEHENQNRDDEVHVNVGINQSVLYVNVSVHDPSIVSSVHENVNVCSEVPHEFDKNCNTVMHDGDGEHEPEMHAVPTRKPLKGQCMNKGGETGHQTIDGRVALTHCMTVVG